MIPPMVPQVVLIILSLGNVVGVVLTRDEVSELAEVWDWKNPCTQHETCKECVKHKGNGVFRGTFTPYKCSWNPQEGCHSEKKKRKYPQWLSLSEDADVFKCGPHLCENNYKTREECTGKEGWDTGWDEVDGNGFKPYDCQWHDDKIGCVNKEYRVCYWGSVLLKRCICDAHLCPAGKVCGGIPRECATASCSEYATCNECLRTKAFNENKDRTTDCAWHDKEGCQDATDKKTAEKVAEGWLARIDNAGIDNAGIDNRGKCGWKALRSVTGRLFKKGATKRSPGDTLKLAVPVGPFWRKPGAKRLLQSRSDINAATGNYGHCWRFSTGQALLAPYIQFESMLKTIQEQREKYPYPPGSNYLEKSRYLGEGCPADYAGPIPGLEPRLDLTNDLNTNFHEMNYGDPAVKRYIVERLPAGGIRFIDSGETYFAWRNGDTLMRVGASRFLSQGKLCGRLKYQYCPIPAVMRACPYSCLKDKENDVPGLNKKCEHVTLEDCQWSKEIPITKQQISKTNAHCPRQCKKLMCRVNGGGRTQNMLAELTKYAKKHEDAPLVRNHEGKEDELSRDISTQLRAAILCTKLVLEVPRRRQSLIDRINGELTTWLKEDPLRHRALLEKAGVHIGILLYSKELGEGGAGKLAYVDGNGFGMDGEVLDFAETDYGNPDDGEIKAGTAKFQVYRIERKTNTLQCKIWKQQFDLIKTKSLQTLYEQHKADQKLALKKCTTDPEPLTIEQINGELKAWLKKDSVRRFLVIQKDKKDIGKLWFCNKSQKLVFAAGEGFDKFGKPGGEIEKDAFEKIKFGIRGGEIQNDAGKFTFARSSLTLKKRTTGKKSLTIAQINGKVKRWLKKNSVRRFLVIQKDNVDIGKLWFSKTLKKLVFAAGDGFDGFGSETAFEKTKFGKQGGEIETNAERFTFVHANYDKKDPLDLCRLWSQQFVIASYFNGGRSPYQEKLEDLVERRPIEKLQKVVVQKMKEAGAHGVPSVTA